MIVILTWAVSGGSPPEDEHGGQQQQLQRTLIIGNVTWRWRAATQTHEILETVYVLSKRAIWSCFISMFTFFVVDSDAGLELEDGVRRNW